MINIVRSLHKASLLPLIGGLILMTPVLAQQPAPPADNGTSANSTLASRSSTPQPALPNSTLTAVPDNFSDLALAPGFLLNVVVYDEPELTTQVRVDDAGNISLPLLGTIHVGGMTVSDAQKAIQDKFRSGEILENPQVTLSVQEYVSSTVTVLGEVQSPGRIQMLAPHSLLDVIGMAGGETNIAGDAVEVDSSAANGGKVETYQYARGQTEDKIRDVMVKPGDTVTVKRAGIVYVLGAVGRPGGYVMQEDGTLNVAQAVSMAYGTLLQAKIGGMRVIRHQPDGGLTDIPIHYNAIMDGKEKPLQLQAQDVVYVPVSKIKTVFTAGASIVGQTAGASIYVAK